MRFLFTIVGRFVTEAFPRAGAVEHLKKLKHETDEAIEDPKNVEEYADCLIALIGATTKAGINYDELITVTYTKMQTNLSRNWEMLPDGTYQHIQ